MALWRIKDMLCRQSSSSVFCQRDLKAKCAPRWAMVKGHNNYSYRERELAWLFLWISLLFLHELETTVILNQPLSIYIRRSVMGFGGGRGGRHQEVRLLAHLQSDCLGHTTPSQQVLSKDENRLSEILPHPGKSTPPSFSCHFKQARAQPAAS